jgi:hypothetical protein
MLCRELEKFFSLLFGLSLVIINPLTGYIMETFHSLTAGSTYINSKGQLRYFAGPAGGHGTYITSDEKEIADLRLMAASVTAQIYAGGAAVKPVDPVIAESAKEAAANTALDAAPGVAALRDKLGATIAATKQA